MAKTPTTPPHTPHPQGRRFRSQFWFDNPGDPNMTALYFERYLNFGFTRAEITSGRPIIGIAQTGSDLSPCNRHHLDLAQRVRDGIRDAGGVALEFPCHPIQETGKRPTAALDRNLSYLSLAEVLYAYPLAGVVLTTACDKPIPAPYHERGQIAYETGRRAVEIVLADLKPCDILTRAAFENAVIVCSAIGGSTNAPIHLTAIARHAGIALSMQDWESIGYDVP